MTRRETTKRKKLLYIFIFRIFSYNKQPWETGFVFWFVSHMDKIKLQSFYWTSRTKQEWINKSITLIAILVLHCSLRNGKHKKRRFSRTGDANIANSSVWKKGRKIYVFFIEKRVTKIKVKTNARIVTFIFIWNKSRDSKG